MYLVVESQKRDCLGLQSGGTTDGYHVSDGVLASTSATHVFVYSLRLQVPRRSVRIGSVRIPLLICATLKPPS